MDPILDNNRLHTEVIRMRWEEEVRAAAKRYPEGQALVEGRREEWKRYSAEVLLPTLERAASILREPPESSSGLRGPLPFAEAQRCIFGNDLESVQLSTGQRDTGILLAANFAARRPSGERWLVEVGSTLGYSLGVSGHVLHWHIHHWFNAIGPSHPGMIEKKSYDVSALSAAMVERHVVQFLDEAIETSFCGRSADTGGRSIGYVLYEESARAPRAGDLGNARRNETRGAPSPRAPASAEGPTEESTR